jgi:UPF0755 protein
MSRKKRGSGAGVILAGFFLLLLAAGAAYWLVFVPFGPAKEMYVELTPGSSTARIGRQLEAAGVVRSRYAFDLMRLWKRGPLRAGEYMFDHPAPVTQVYARIVRGDVYAKAVTIPEGANSFEIAARLEQAGYGPQQDFLDAVAKQAGQASFWAECDSGPDLRNHGAAFSRRSESTGIEGKCASSGDFGFTGGTGDGTGLRTPAGGERF